MNIREELKKAAQANALDIDFHYIEQGTVVAGSGDVNIGYVKTPSGGYFSAVSTKYTQVDSPYIPRDGGEPNVTGDVVNANAWGGGFKIEDRPEIGPANP